MENSFDFREESRLIQRSSYQYIFPPMIGLLFAQCSPMADSIFVSGTLGTEAFSAIVTVGPFAYVFNVIAALFGIGAAVVISRCSGSGEKEKAARIFTRSLRMMVIITIILSACAIVFIDPLLHIFSATPENFNYAKEYALGMLPGAVFIVLNFAGDYILANDNNKNLAMAGDIVGALMNIVFDYIGLYMLHCGIWVAGLGTAFGSFCCCLVYLLHFRKKDRLCRFVSPKRTPGDHDMLEIIKPGTAVALMYILSSAELLIRNYVLSKSAGTSGLSNSEVIENLYFALSIVIAGISNAIYPMASAFHGEQNKSGMLMVKRSLLRTGFLMMLILVVILFSFPQLAIMPYQIDDPVVLRTLPYAIRIIAAVDLLIMINMVMINYLSAVEVEKNANMAMLIWYMVQISFTLLLSSRFAMNAPWYAAAIAQIVVLVYLTCFCDRLAKGLWKYHRENLLVLQCGRLDAQGTEELEEIAGGFLASEQLKMVKEEMILPLLNVLPGGVFPEYSFTILEREDGKRAVILRYVSSKDLLGSESETEESENENDDTEIPLDTCIRSEFLGMRRLMMVMST